MKYKSWNEFWGEFLQVKFHQGQPELWPSRERKAQWFRKNADLQPGARILDPGCGDGLIDIWLSRMGFDVTALDRNQKVLEVAKQSDDTKKVHFQCLELQDAAFEPESFDGVLLIETLGLMSKQDDRRFLGRIYSWLKAGGSLIVDCPAKVDEKNVWSKEYPEGVIRGDSSFDPSTHYQNIQFFFKPNGEEEFGIFDPYNSEMPAAPGIVRYLYPQEELRKTLEDMGFKVTPIEHYYEKNYYGLLAKK